MSTVPLDMSNGMSFPKEPPLPPIHRGSVYVPSESGRFSTASQNDSAANNPAFDDISMSISGKLSNVEAQRIISVLQEIQRKVQLIGLLPDVIDKRVSAVFGGETFNLIKDHRQLEVKYKTLLDSKAHEKGVAGHELSTELKETSKLLRTSTRSLTRHFLHNPSALNKLRYLKSTKTQTVAQFEHLLQEVKNLTFERLKTTVEEEEAKQDQLSVIIAKEHKTSNEVKILKEDLEKAKKERMHDINKKNEVIRKLKEELRDIKLQAEEATKKLESKSKQKEDSDMQQFQDKELSLMRDISSLTATLADLSIKNREEEALYRKKKFKIESEVDNWIAKYDQEMEEKQAEIDDISAIFEEEKTQLSQLEKKYAEQKMLFDNIMEERRLAEEKRKHDQQLLERMSAAVVRIQAMYRGWAVRRAMARAKDKSSKKGKKK